MSVFTDQMLLRFLQDTFVQDLLINQLGLIALFNITYNVQDIDLKQIELSGIQRREFAVPAFETIRTSGIDEKFMPSTERVKVDRAQPRYGRLAWMDAFFDVQLATKVESKKMPIESITAQDLSDKLSGVTSIQDLKDKLGALYPQSIVDAFFTELRITSIDDFKRRHAVFLEFVYKAPQPFDPNDPGNARTFPLNVCIQLQSEFKITEALQSAKLCRSILENERDFASTFDGGDIETPYAFVVIFPNSAVVDGTIPDLTAPQIKAGTKSLLQAERMLAHFV